MCLFGLGNWAGQKLLPTIHFANPQLPKLSSYTSRYHKLWKEQYRYSFLLFVLYSTLFSSFFILWREHIFYLFIHSHFMCMNALPACVCILCILGTHGGQKSMPDALNWNYSYESSQYSYSWPSSSKSIISNRVPPINGW